MRLVTSFDAAGRLNQLDVLVDPLIGHIVPPHAVSVNTGDTDLRHQRKCPARRCRAASHDRAHQGREALVF